MNGWLRLLQLLEKARRRRRRSRSEGNEVEEREERGLKGEGKQAYCKGARGTGALVAKGKPYLG